MVRTSPSALPPSEAHLLTAREAIEPLYDELELETDRAVLKAAVKAGWSSDEASKALASLRLLDALSVLEKSGAVRQRKTSRHEATRTL